MSKKTAPRPFIPPLPHINKFDPDTIEKIQNMSKKEMRQFKKSDSYKKYVQPVLDREKQQCFEQRKAWFWDKGMLIINTLLSLIAAITGIIALLQ